MLQDYIIYYGIAFLAVIISVAADIKVRNTFSRNNEIMSKKNVTGAKFARDILDAAGLTDIEVIKISGTMTDYYNHKKKVLALSSSYDGTSVAALGIAAHEVGHALQYKENYLPIKIRNTLIPVMNFSSKAMVPLMLVGLLISIFIGVGLFAGILIIGGCAVYTISFILNLATLPVEFNASKRAKQLLLDTGAVDEEEIDGVSEVLSAAALTYVAALLVSLLYLIRFMLMFRDRD